MTSTPNVDDHKKNMTEVNIMFCTNCGTELLDNSKFCHNCGQPVNGPVDNKPDFMALARQEYDNKSNWRKSFSKSAQQKEIQKIADKLEKSWIIANTDGEVYTCPKCKGLVDKSDLECNHCGCSIRLTVCTSCGRRYMRRQEARDGLCPKCGLILWSG